MAIVVPVLAVIIMLVGIAGTIIPFLPGIPMVFVGIAIYGWYEGFQLISAQYLCIMAVLAVLSLFVDYASTYLGAKHFGSSKKGMYGAILGTFLGLFILPPAGILIGPWIGAVLGEYIDNSDWKKSFNAGIGTIIGLFSGMLFQLILAILMFISFLIIIF